MTDDIAADDVFMNSPASPVADGQRSSTARGEPVGTDPTMRQFTVRDDARQLRFNGRELASSSSFRAEKDRWIEFTLYRTDAGRYVLARVGCTSLPDESTRYWANVSDTPQGVVETLYLIDDDGVRYLTRVARELLDEASLVDPDLSAAYHVEVVE